MAEVSTTDSEEGGFSRQVGKICLATKTNVRGGRKTTDTILCNKAFLLHLKLESGWVRIPEARSISRRGVRMNAADAKSPGENGVFLEL